MNWCESVDPKQQNHNIHYSLQVPFRRTGGDGAEVREEPSTMILVSYLLFLLQLLSLHDFILLFLCTCEFSFLRYLTS